MTARGRASFRACGPRWRTCLSGVAIVASGCAGQTRVHLDPIPRGVYVDASVVYYDVTAANIIELRRAMRESGPRIGGRAWQGATSSRFRWTYSYERQGATCALSRVRVQLTTRVTFPRWNPTAPPDSVMLAWWTQLNAGLMEHERGHALLSVKAAGDIVQRLEGMSHLDCGLLREQANAAARRLLDLERRDQSEYDRTTGHGATQIRQAAADR